MPNPGDVDSTSPKTRRRDEVLLAAIREATRAEVAEHSYMGVTFEGVARRAKTGKPVLYRRYPSRARMIVDALRPVRLDADLISADRTLRENLLTVLDAIIVSFNDIGVETFRHLAVEADDELFESMTATLAEVTDQVIYRALSIARERNEIGSADIANRTATTIVALVRNELFFTRNPVDHEVLADMLDTVYLPLITAVSHGRNTHRHVRAQM